MDLRRLEVFAKVAELGSFSRAAEALFLTQPTVSEHVQALEEELGVQLLDRLGRGATPTPAGELLLGYAQRILRLTHEARQAIDRFQGRMSGQLIVGGSTIPGEYILPALIGQFKGKYPDISISLRVGSAAFGGAGEMGSTRAVKQAVRAGVGIAMISKRAVEDECRARLLSCVKVRDLNVTRSFHLVTHRDRTRSPLAQAFLEFVESQAADRTS